MRAPDSITALFLTAQKRLQARAEATDTVIMRNEETVKIERP